MLIISTSQLVSLLLLNSLHSVIHADRAQTSCAPQRFVPFAYKDGPGETGPRQIHGRPTYTRRLVQTRRGRSFRRCLARLPDKDEPGLKLDRKQRLAREREQPPQRRAF